MLKCLIMLYLHDSCSSMILLTDMESLSMETTVFGSGTRQGINVAATVLYW